MLVRWAGSLPSFFLSPFSSNFPRAHSFLFFVTVRGLLVLFLQLVKPPPPRVFSTPFARIFLNPKPQLFVRGGPFLFPFTEPFWPITLSVPPTWYNLGYLVSPPSVRRVWPTYQSHPVCFFVSLYWALIPSSVVPTPSSGDRRAPRQVRFFGPVRFPDPPTFFSHFCSSLVFVVKTVFTLSRNFFCPPFRPAPTP